MNALVPGLNTVKDPPSGRSISSMGRGKGDRSMSNSGTLGGWEVGVVDVVGGLVVVDVVGGIVVVVVEGGVVVVIVV